MESSRGWCEIAVPERGGGLKSLFRRGDGRGNEMLTWLTETKLGVGSGFGQVIKSTDKRLGEWEDE